MRWDVLSKWKTKGYVVRWKEKPWLDLCLFQMDTFHAPQLHLDISSPQHGIRLIRVREKSNDNVTKRCTSPSIITACQLIKNPYCFSIAITAAVCASLATIFFLDFSLAFPSPPPDIHRTNIGFVFVCVVRHLVEALPLSPTQVMWNHSLHTTRHNICWPSHSPSTPCNHLRLPWFLPLIKAGKILANVGEESLRPSRRPNKMVSNFRISFSLFFYSMAFHNILLHSLMNLYVGPIIINHTDIFTWQKIYLLI